MEDNNDLKLWLGERFDRLTDKLEALKVEFNDRASVMDAAIKHNRNNADAKFDAQVRVIEKLDSRVGVTEDKVIIVEAKQARSQTVSGLILGVLATVAVAIIGGLCTLASGWISGGAFIHH
jgi:hypothetical protein